MNGSNEHHRQLKRPRSDDDTFNQYLSKSAHEASIKSPNSKVLGKKKSVSFTSDTKIEDGDSAQTIQFMVPDSPGSTPRKPNDEPSEEQSPALPTRSKKVKKPKGSKSTSLPRKPRKASAALEYLEQFHRQRADWKFNKNHETWILKHALSTEQIPSEQNLALATYIRGLRSAGSRQRLAEQSRNTLMKNKISLEKIDEEGEHFETLIEKSSLDSDAQFKQPTWLGNFDRGALILLALKESLRHSTQQARGKDSKPLVKKNKSRTSRIEVDSSSSDSDSDSDDESEHDTLDSQTARLSDNRAVPAGDISEETSSDSSSRSSSDSKATSDSSSDEQ